MIFTPYPDWWDLPDPIVDRCKCGQHPRTTDKTSVLRWFRTRNRSIIDGSVRNGGNSAQNNRDAHQRRRERRVR